MRFHPLTTYADPNITPEEANLRLPFDKVVVALYSNREVRQSVVHSHPYHEFILMLSGKAVYLTNGSRYDLHPGELMLVPPGMVHAGYYDTYDRLILQIDDTFWRETLVQVGLLPPGNDAPLEFLILHADAVYNWGLRALIERAAAAATMDDLHSRELMYRSQLVELALIIRQIVSENQLGKPTASNPLVAKVAAYIQEHYRDPDLNVTQLAQVAYVSREHLSRVFKEYTTESLYGYLTNLRMQGCRQAIAEGKSILDACTENGFSNYSSFLKTFRKLYGMTPAEYRAQLRTALAK